MIEITSRTAVLERHDFLANDNGESCPDCPDRNTNPPRESDCQYFEVRSGIPVCTKEGNTQRMIENWLKSGIGNLACPSLVEVIEADTQLPEV